MQVIADHAFYEYDDILQELVLGSSVSSVGTGAFTYCKVLTDVIFLSTEPPAINDLTANGTYTDNMTIHVHKSAVEAYKDIISDFKNLELFELTFDNSARTLDVSDDPNTYTVSSSWVSAEPDSYTFSHNANSSLIWSSSNTDIATVSSDGVITAVAKGECTITAKSVFGEEFTLTLTVTDRNENFTGVSNISSDDTPFRAYTISGIEVVTRPLAHGLYIIVYEDGRVEEKGF